MNGDLSNYKSNRQATLPLEVLHRTAGADKAAITDCVDVYGKLVWALAKRFTNSNEEAEKAVLHIFNEIWKCAEYYDPAKCAEKDYVLQTAYRQLVIESKKSCH